MDQVSNRSGVGSDDVTDETASLVDVRWSSEEEEVIKFTVLLLRETKHPVPIHIQLNVFI